MPIITLLTDFGTVDTYVAQMKGQILAICPGATLVDITHAVPPQDVAYGSLLLSQAVPYFPDGSIHIAVVDPGVGTGRAILAVELECSAPSDGRKTRQRLVLPDNGLAGLIAEQSQIVAMHKVTDPRFWNSTISSTFHGRDIMGPVAAHWAAGQTIDAFGPKCDEMQSTPWVSSVRIGSFNVRGMVVALDHFGNVITNIPSDWLVNRPPNSRCRVHFDGQSMELPVAKTYGELDPGQALVLVGSHGFVELAVVGGSAATTLAIKRGIEVELAIA